MRPPESDRITFAPADPTIRIAHNNREVMRWTGEDLRCEIWTGKRWVDLEELLQRLERAEDLR